MYASAAAEAALGGPHGTWVDMTGPVTRLRAWRGAESDLGCRWPEPGVLIAQGVKAGAPPDARAVTAAVMNVKRTAGGVCAVEYVLAVSAEFPRSLCGGADPVGFLRFAPSASRAPRPQICVAVEAGGASTRPFFTEAGWRYLQRGPIAMSPPPLPAPLRCDQGLYMGFTNIIQSLVTCVVHALLAGRRESIFPGAVPAHVLRRAAAH